MKKIFITLALALYASSYAQIEFSNKTKKTYQELLSKAIANGLDEDAAKKEAIQNKEFIQLQNEDLQKAMKKGKNSDFFVSKDFSKVILHKKVAIIPFITDIDDNTTKKQSKKQKIADQKDLSERIQESLYRFLMKKQFDYTVEFQDIGRTNQILKNSGVLNTLTSTPLEEIAKLLGVDAIISGSFLQEKNRESLGSTAAKAYLTMGTSLLLSSTKKTQGNLNLKVSDGISGDVLWRMEREEKESGGSEESSIGLVNSIMKKVAKGFPYDKQLLEK